jgi:hypothetical protein
MRQFLGFGLTFYALFFSFWCFAGAEKKPGQPLSFDVLAKLAPGSVTKAQLSKLLGKPTEIINFKDLPDSKETGMSWKYEENGLGRLTVFFDEGSEVASSWIWHVYDGDPEQNIKTAMSRYVPASWEPETDKWINPHNHPNECYFKDKKEGVSLEYNRTRKEVFSIARWDPSRKLASDKDEKRPVFCIENSCSPAYSAEEFFKGSSVSKYCELPK